ncbi:MAG: EAL domain-containing protein, partial [Acidimicrobiales bacterium]
QILKAFGHRIRNAAIQKRALSGPTSSVPQLSDTFTTGSRGRCFAAPALSAEGRLVGVIALLSGPEHLEQEALGVLTVSAGLAALSLPKQHPEPPNAPTDQRHMHGFDNEHNSGHLPAAGADAELARLLKAGSVVPHYQPQLNLRSGEIIGVEALARKVEGNAAESIPQLLQVTTSPTTREFTQNILRQVCSDIMRWEPVLTPEFKVSVNAPAEELCDMAFVDTVRNALRISGVAAERLCIEVTESESMSSQGLAAVVLQELRKMGVSVAVDDFGTGYSSLAYLLRLPIDLIKIDRSFVSGLPQDRSSLAIIGAVVDVAREIGMTVLAEGVETPEQAQALVDIGVQYAQGWLYSPAISARDFVALLGTKAEQRSMG